MRFFRKLVEMFGVNLKLVELMAFKIEVQTGSYFGEDDIERVEDDFGR